MTLPTNIYDSLPTTNLVERSKIINGINFDEDPYLWVLEQVAVGNIVPIFEFTVTLPEIPPNIIYDNLGISVFQGLGSSSTDTMVDGIVTTIYYDAENNIIPYAGSGFLNPGDTFRVQAIVMGGPMSVSPPYGSALNLSANMNVIAVPETSLHLPLVLLFLCAFAKRKPLSPRSDLI